MTEKGVLEQLRRNAGRNTTAGETHAAIRAKARAADGINHEGGYRRKTEEATGPRGPGRGTGTEAATEEHHSRTHSLTRPENRRMAMGWRRGKTVDTHTREI